MIKRFLDIVLSLTVLVFAFPLLLVLSVLCLKKMGSPIFFKQQRPGKNGNSFYMLKFRSMLDATDDKGDILPDSERLTKFGAFLRSSSLDELPGFINVLIGDMSLVGPRPLLNQYLALYNAEQGRRHEVRPGITGWAQVNGRNAISWEDKFKYDVWYIDNQCLFLDVKILLLTVKKVFVREGISAAGHATTEAFKGTKDD